MKPFHDDAKVSMTGAGYMRIEHSMEGWAGCRWDSRDTRLDVRRVDPDGDDHVQMEIVITEYFEKSGTTRSKRGFVRLAAKDVAKLIEHLSKPWGELKR